MARPDRQKTQVDIEIARLQYQTRAFFWDRFFGAVRTIAKGLAWVGCLYCTYLIFHDLAGKVTILDAGVRGLLKLSADRYIAYMVGGLGATGYVIERRNRKRATKELGHHIEELENRIDPKRSHSGLTPTGTARKEDLE